MVGVLGRGGRLLQVQSGHDLGRGEAAHALPAPGGLRGLDELGAGREGGRASGGGGGGGRRGLKRGEKKRRRLDHDEGRGEARGLGDEHHGRPQREPRLVRVRQRVQILARGVAWLSKLARKRKWGANTYKRVRLAKQQQRHGGRGRILWPRFNCHGLFSHKGKRKRPGPSEVRRRPSLSAWAEVAAVAVMVVVAAATTTATTTPSGRRPVGRVHVSGSKAVEGFKLLRRPSRSRFIPGPLDWILPLRERPQGRWRWRTGDEAPQSQSPPP